MKTALTASMTSLALQLRKTPTWDRGTELAGHADFTLTTGTQYLLKGTDLSRWDAHESEAIAGALNNRPRKVLGFRTPAEILTEQIQSMQNDSAATID